jgi:DNA-binding transcriptional MerR regulator
MTPEPQLFNSHQAARLCRVSLRQLQWWDEQGICSPVKIGHKRFYTTQEIVTLERIHDLRRAGVGLSKVKKYLKWDYTSVVKLTCPGIINGTLVVPK